MGYSMQADSLSPRCFLGSSASTVAAVSTGVGLPQRTARACVSASDLNFIFVVNNIALLALAGIDPAVHISGAEPLLGLLA